MSTVRKAVIPAAGLGTRSLPATKAQPKEMLPVADKPSIQYVVEEAAAAGLDDVLVITSRGKRAIEDHFDRNVELELYLEAKGKLDLLKEVQAVNDLARVHYVRQHEPLGLGHAVSVARDHVGGESFAVLLGDDMMVDDARLLQRMLDVHHERDAPVLAILEVPLEEISAYGCAEAEAVAEGVVLIRSLVEKPSPDAAPSNLAVIGRYVFTPDIFEALEEIEPGTGGELQLTDAIALLAQRRPVYGCVFRHGRYDIGRKIDFLRANIELSLERPDVGPQLGELLADIVRRRDLS